MNMRFETGNVAFVSIEKDDGSVYIEVEKHDGQKWRFVASTTLQRHQLQEACQALAGGDALQVQQAWSKVAERQARILGGIDAILDLTVGYTAEQQVAQIRNLLAET